MDEQGRPDKWWARLLFEPREHSVAEYRLGLGVVAVAGIFTWLIFWSFIPTLIFNTVVGIANGISWIAGLFSGSGANEATAPVVTPGATVLPSPLPSPSPSALPSPIPSPFPR
jgi:hypothetical protein